MADVLIALGGNVGEVRATFQKAIANICGMTQAALLARKAGLASRFVYRPQAPGSAGRIWQTLHPRDVVLTAEHAAQVEEINPDRIRYELTPRGKIAHLLKSW